MRECVPRRRAVHDVTGGAADTHNVVLTGFMGTGKSTVGRVLARRLDAEFVDTDALIEERYGPIADIFADQGEEAFREYERETAAALALRPALVIATGGRMMVDPACAAELGRTGRVFCLVASVDAILERVTSDESRVERPLLAAPDPRRRIIELLNERHAAYRRFSQVQTDGRSPEAVADDIVARLGLDAPNATHDVS